MTYIRRRREILSIGRLRDFWREVINRRSPIVFAALLIASCQPAGVLDPQGPVGSAERLLLFNATAIMLVVVVPVILATLAFAWWYRSSNPRATRAEDKSYEGRLEFVVWSIPALVVILLGGVIWIGSHQLVPRAPLPSDAKPLDVDVASLDWKWLFIYPEHGIAAVNQLVVPAGTPVRFHLTSATVMNSFCAAARQPDLHDAWDDHPPEPTGIKSWCVSRNFGEFQRRRFCRYAVYRRGSAGR